MQLLLETGPLAYAQIALLAAGLVWAMACAVFYGLRWKVPPVVAVAPLGAHALVVVGGTLLASSQVNEAVANVDPSMKATLLAQGIAETLGHGQLALAAVPTAALLVLAGLFSGVRGTRAYGAPGVALVCGLASAGLTGASILAHGEMPLAIGRALIYAIAAPAVAAALAGHHSQDSSREGGITAAVAFAALVAACEAMVLARGWSLGFRALAMASADTKVELVGAIAEDMGRIEVFSWAALAFAFVPGVVALLRPAAELTEEEVLQARTSPSGLRWLGGALALGVPVIWTVALMTTDPSALLVSIAK
jgi:hypothetical protein